MGKYMKKGKITGDVAVMEISQSTSSLGVRTRARTLALQLNPDVSFQLHSRSLEKPPVSSSKQKQQSSKVRVNSDNGSNSKGRFGHFSDEVCCGVSDTEDFHDMSTVEASFGENNLEFDSRERNSRESTPCSLIRDSETIATPGSTTRRTCSAPNRRARNSQRTMPTNPEMEAFFAGFEHHQQKLFVEKYNYDIKNDVPLPGRYEWVKVD